MTLPSVEPLPLLRTPDAALLAAYLTDMTHEVDPEMLAEYMQETGQRNPGGRRPRNRYVAGELAYMADVEGRRGFTGGDQWSREPTDHPFTDWTQRAYLDPDSTLSATVLTWTADSHRLRAEKVKKTRQYGRRVLSALGAWPWALARGGVLPEGWRDHVVYVGALGAWVAGKEIDAALMPDRAG